MSELLLRVTIAIDEKLGGKGQWHRMVVDDEARLARESAKDIGRTVLKIITEVDWPEIVVTTHGEDGPIALCIPSLTVRNLIRRALRLEDNTSIINIKPLDAPGTQIVADRETKEPQAPLAEQVAPVHAWFEVSYVDGRTAVVEVSGTLPGSAEVLALLIARERQQSGEIPTGEIASVTRLAPSMKN